MNFAIIFLWISAIYIYVANGRERYSRYTNRIIRKDVKAVHYTEYARCSYGICTSPSQYPQEYIEQLLADNTFIRSAFGKIIDTDLDLIPVIGTRHGGTSDIKNLCDSSQNTTLVPRVMKNIKDSWKYIVNVPGYEQSFKVSTCFKHEANSKCNNSLLNGICEEDKKIKINSVCTNSFPSFTCQQKFQVIPLLTFENGVLQYDRFSIPTICACMHTSKICTK